MSFRQDMEQKWETARPILLGLVIGLVAGPILVLWMGWVVTVGAVNDKVEVAVVDLEASICAARARASAGYTTALDFQARNKLAQKFAAMPGQDPDSVTYEVTNACTEKLAEAAS